MPSPFHRPESDPFPSPGVLDLQWPVLPWAKKMANNSLTTFTHCSSSESTERVTSPNLRLLPLPHNLRLGPANLAWPLLQSTGAAQPHWLPSSYLGHLSCSPRPVPQVSLESSRAKADGLLRKARVPPYSHESTPLETFNWIQVNCFVKPLNCG